MLARLIKAVSLSARTASLRTLNLLAEGDQLGPAISISAHPYGQNFRYDFPIKCPLLDGNESRGNWRETDFFSRKNLIHI